MNTKEVSFQEKKQIPPSAERTEAATFFVPYADIHETADHVVVSLEMPGVDKSAIDVTVEKNVLKVEGSIDSATYGNMNPIYTEYNVGNFTRSFTLSTQIDSENISANLADGVLIVMLPKAKEVVARRIEVR